jgi:AcrR family transcriptional regulator
LFDEVGYQHASMNDMAAAVGIAKPSLYHYFNSKEAVLNAIFDELQDIFEQALSAAELMDSPADQLRAGMAAIMDLLDTSPGYLRVWIEYHDELTKSNRRKQMARQQRVFEYFRSSIRRGIDRGDFRQVDPALVATAFLSICSNSYRWYRQGGPRTAASLSQEFSSYLLEGIRAVPPP